MERLKIQAKDDNLSIVTEWVEDLIRKECTEEKTISEILIAVDELFINICHYAYEGETGEAEFWLEISENPKRVRLRIKDQGTPFNPLALEDPDITLSAKERKIGGLGIFMVKDFMDDVDYAYVDAHNVVTLEKHLEK